MEVASTSDRAKSFGRFLESLGTGLLGDRLAGGQISRGSADKFRERDVLAGGPWTGDEETRPSPSFRPTASFHSVYYTASFNSTTLLLFTLNLG